MEADSDSSFLSDDSEIAYGAAVVDDVGDVGKAQAAQRGLGCGTLSGVDGQMRVLTSHTQWLVC